MNCDAVIELLPWLLNDSLENEERVTLVTHLRTCQRCLRELEETAAAAEIFSQHISSLELAGYAMGLPPSGLGQKQIEVHLSDCTSCRDELQLAMADSIIDFGAAQQRLRSGTWQARPGARAGRRRALAVAAGIVLMAVSGALIWSSVEFNAGAQLESSAIRVEGQQTPSAAMFSDGFELGDTRAWLGQEEPEV